MVHTGGHNSARGTDCGKYFLPKMVGGTVFGGGHLSV